MSSPLTSHDIGKAVQSARQRQKLTQAELAAAAGVGKRFVVELEAGKPTVQLGKVLQVMSAAGVDITLTPRAAS